MFFYLFFIRLRRRPRSTLFPYTTLFRSHPRLGQDLGDHGRERPRPERRADRRRRHDRPEPEGGPGRAGRSEEHTSELQSRFDLVCRLLLEKKKPKKTQLQPNHAETKRRN